MGCLRHSDGQQTWLDELVKVPGIEMWTVDVAATTPSMPRSGPVVENDLQRTVIELAEMLGFRVYHNARAKGNLPGQDLGRVPGPRPGQGSPLDLLRRTRRTVSISRPEQKTVEGRDRGVR